MSRCRRPLTLLGDCLGVGGRRDAGSQRQRRNNGYPTPQGIPPSATLPSSVAGFGPHSSYDVRFSNRHANHPQAAPSKKTWNSSRITSQSRLRCCMKTRNGRSAEGEATRIVAPCSEGKSGVGGQSPPLSERLCCSFSHSVLVFAKGGSNIWPEGIVRANYASGNRPALRGPDAEPVPLLQLITRGDPPCGDDVREIPSLAAQRRGCPRRARDRHPPSDRAVLVEPLWVRCSPARCAGSGFSACAPTPTGAGAWTRST